MRAEHPPVPTLIRTPKVSTLVAAWNEGSQIEAHLRSFLELTYPDIELILCAGGTDETYVRALRYAGPHVTVIEQQPGEGKQRALARCLEYATGEIVYLTDADCLFDDEALTRLLAPLVNEGEQVATGSSRLLDEQMEQILPRHLWAAEMVSDAHRSTISDGLLGRNAALTRNAIAHIGGLNYQAPTGTDYQLAKRLLQIGLTIRFVRESVVSTGYPETFITYQRKQSRWLRNLLIYGPVYEAWKDVAATRRTLAIGLGMLLLPVVGLRLRPVLLLWFLLLSHGMLARLRYASFSTRLSGHPVPAMLFAAIPALTMADVVVWSMPLLDLIDSARRSRW
ncbi:hypothetical protein A9Q02_13450 [Candidatus Chloroploca asiatica]|uniref:Glycosyl transferase n=1 Tax=Candidatus Chloroploca asiatica TaxID=1506545 RepID=A0A2H3KM06_9CHLR|nr:hypothetical protein A9Q02_13450 [Candidatus Chloroploca asiatica]